MDVRACDGAKAQIESVELRRDSYRSGETDVGETDAKQNVEKNSSEIKRLCKASIIPCFIIRPADTFISANQTGFIEARINGVTEPKPIVKWYKDGQLIIDSLNSRIKTHHYEPDTYILEIQDALESDMGSYTCAARNCYGRIASSATVKVVDSEIQECPQFLKHLQSVDVFAGRNCRLEVRVTGVPKPKVKWLKNGLPLKQSEHIEMRHYEPYSYVLNINKTVVEDSGLYTCQALNDVDKIGTSAMVHVEGDENLYIYRPLCKEVSEDRNRIRRQLERKRCPDEWSQSEKDDLLYKMIIAKYHMNYRTPSCFYSNLFS